MGDCFAETARRPLVDNFDAKVSGADFEENLPQALRAAGYLTGHAGKWHLRANGGKGVKFENYTEAKRLVHLAGFDWVGGLYEHNFESYDKKPYSGPWGNWSHNLEWVTAEARKFISEANSDGRPFFLHYAATTPHAPDVYQAMEQFSPLETPEGTLSEMPDSCMPSRESMLERIWAVLTDEQRAAAGKGEKYCVWPGVWESGHGCWLTHPGLAASYAAGSIWTDEAFGAVVSHLADLGILDNTVVVAFSDHGKPGKGTLNEAGVRTWLSIRYPELFTPGTRDDRMVSLQDLMPTFLDLAGVEPPYVLDGRSLVPQAPPRPAQVAINSVLQPSILGSTEEPQEEDRMLFLELFADRALVTRNFKYVDRPPRVKERPDCHIDEPPVQQLFDLRWDTYESFNMSGVLEYEYLVQEFAARIDCVDKVLGLDTSMEDARGKSYEHCLDMKLSFTDTSAEENGIDWGGPVLPAGCEKEKTLQACYFGDLFYGLSYGLLW